MGKTLCISGGGQVKEYKCKSTHTGIPYLRVGTEYLDLTSRTTTGLHLNVRYGNQIYIPIQSYTTTTTQIEYIPRITGYSGVSTSYVTTGYSGITSSIKTTGYTGTSSKKSTSGYSGSLSRKSTSGYSGKRSSAYTSATYYSNSVKTSSKYYTTVTSKYGTNTKRPRWSKSSRATKSAAYTNAATYSKTASGAGASGTFTAYLLSGSRTSNGSNGEGWSQCGVSTSSGTYRTSVATSPKYKTATRTSNVTSSAAGALSSTTALTRASYYNATSAAVGALSSTTALTRVSYYGTSAGAVGNMSSTSALTAKSTYYSNSAGVGNMSSTTALKSINSQTISATVTNGLVSITTLSTYVSTAGTYTTVVTD